MKRLAAAVVLLIALSVLVIAGGAQELQVPATVKANTPLSVPSSGSGDGVLTLPDRPALASGTSSWARPSRSLPKRSTQRGNG